ARARRTRGPRALVTQAGAGRGWNRAASGGGASFARVANPERPGEELGIVAAAPDVAGVRDHLLVRAAQGRRPVQRQRIGEPRPEQGGKALLVAGDREQRGAGRRQGEVLG